MPIGIPLSRHVRKVPHMSSESSEQSSAVKVLIGCLIAGVVGVLLCGGAIVFFAYKGAGFLQQVAKEAGPAFKAQMEQIQFAETWQPPAADARAEQLFPATVGGWSLSGHDDAAAIPELAIERDGLHGTYESVGTTINVYVYQVPMTEQSQIFSAATAAIDGAGYKTQSKEDVDVGTAHWMPFNFSPPERFGRMWWTKDWLVVLLTESAAVNLAGFEKDYLTAIEAPPVPGMEEPAATESAEPADGTPPQPDEPAETTPDAADPAAENTAPAEPDSGETAPDKPPAN
jgi:hypothetical protein